MQVSFAHSFRQARYSFFKWRYETDFFRKLALAFAFAGLTGVGAQLKFALPFTPVPVTCQTFFVLLSGVMLGRNYGAAAQVLYASLGGAGVPWFAPKAGMPAFSNGGLAVLKGATGGYIVGFVVAAYVIGWFVDSFVRARRLSFLVPLMLLGTAIIYAFGAAWLAVVLGTGAKDAVLKGVLPFVPGDMVKAFAVIALASVLLPKESYGSERDFMKESRLSYTSGYLRNAGAAISAALCVFFLALFWLKMLELKSADAAQILSATLWYTIPLAVCGFLALRFMWNRD